MVLTKNYKGITKINFEANFMNFTNLFNYYLFFNQKLMITKPINILIKNNDTDNPPFVYI